ncbi:hypothetical protein SUDANB120_01195 [Streptomyces sp. enrichment culture]
MRLGVSPAVDGVRGGPVPQGRSLSVASLRDGLTATLDRPTRPGGIFSAGTPPGERPGGTWTNKPDQRARSPAPVAPFVPPASADPSAAAQLALTSGNDVQSIIWRQERDRSLRGPAFFGGRRPSGAGRRGRSPRVHPCHPYLAAVGRRGWEAQQIAAGPCVLGDRQPSAAWGVRQIATSPCLLGDRPPSGREARQIAADPCLLGGVGRRPSTIGRRSSGVGRATDRRRPLSPRRPPRRQGRRVRSLRVPGCLAAGERSWAAKRPSSRHLPCRCGGRPPSGRRSAPARCAPLSFGGRRAVMGREAVRLAAHSMLLIYGRLAAAGHRIRLPPPPSGGQSPNRRRPCSDRTRRRAPDGRRPPKKAGPRGDLGRSCLRMMLWASFRAVRADRAPLDGTADAGGAKGAAGAGEKAL